MIWTMGELIVEIMRDKEDSPLDKAGAIELLGALVAMTANGPVEPEPVDETPPED